MNQKTDSQKKADNLRKDVAGVFAILLGIGLGLFIRRVKVGLVIGIVLGLIAISLFRKK